MKKSFEFTVFEEVIVGNNCVSLAYITIKYHKS
jgi:hypothetical protein